MQGVDPDSVQLQHSASIRPCNPGDYQTSIEFIQWYLNCFVICQSGGLPSDQIRRDPVSLVIVSESEGYGLSRVTEP